MVGTNSILLAFKKKAQRLKGLGSEPSCCKVAGTSFPPTQTWSWCLGRFAWLPALFPLEKGQGHKERKVSPLLGNSTCSRNLWRQHPQSHHPNLTSDQKSIPPCISVSLRGFGGGWEGMFHNYQNLEATKMSFNRWMDKQTVHKKEMSYQVRLRHGGNLNAYP